MNRVITLALFVTAMSAMTHAQPPDTLWTKVYGGSFYEQAFSIIPLDEGGYMAAGYRVATYNGDEDIWLLRIAENGDTLWTKCYEMGGSERAWCIQRTYDGGFIVCGETEAFNVQWDPDVFLMKTDENGDSLWFHHWGGDNLDAAYNVKETPDHGFALVGTTESFGENWKNVWLIRTDSVGDTLWTKTFGSTGQGTVEGKSLDLTDDGGFIIVGRTQFFGTTDYEEVYLIKTDNTGVAEWQTVYGGDTSSEWGESVVQTEDGGFIIGANFREMSADWDWYFIKTDQDGNVDWTTKLGGDGNDYMNCVRQTSDGGFIGAGSYTVYNPYAQIDFAALKIDSAGDSVWLFEIGDGSEDEAAWIEETGDDEYILAGTRAYSNVYLVKLGGELGIPIKEPGQYPKSYALHKAYPNPFNLNVTLGFDLPMSAKVSLEIFDVTGRSAAKVVEGYYMAGVHEVIFDASTLASGLYIYWLRADQYTSAGKIILLK